MDKRLLTEPEALEYTALGKTKGRQWLREIGARRVFGRAVRYDLETIDRAIDEQSRQAGGT